MNFSNIKTFVLVLIFLFVCAGLLWLLVFQKQDQNLISATESVKLGAMKIDSSVFSHNGKIPAKYTCDGEDINPPLAFSNVPKEAKSLALIMDDPDASNGVWVHWVVWNLPALPTGQAGGRQAFHLEEATTSIDAVVGENSWHKNEYGGPCPHQGEHRYFFKLYALNSTLDLPTSSDKTKLEEAMQGKIIEQAELIGLYQKVN